MQTGFFTLLDSGPVFMKSRILPWLPSWFVKSVDSAKFDSVNNESDLSESDSADFKTKMAILALLYSLYTQLWTTRAQQAKLTQQLCLLQWS